MELSKFSKDEAIKNHREMWLWIASEYARGVCGTVYYLKSEYVKKHFPENNLLADCFLCTYAGFTGKVSNYIPECSNCPLDWSVDPSDDTSITEGYCIDRYKYEDNEGLLGLLISISDNQAVSKDVKENLANQIANLPEKEES